MFQKIIDIATLYLRITFSRREVLLSQLLVPLIFTFVLGQATGGGGGDIATEWQIAISNEDEGTFGELVVERLQQDESLTIQLLSPDEAVAAVERQEAMAALQIPREFSEQLQARQSVTLGFSYDPDYTVQVQFIEQNLLATVGQLEGMVTAATFSTSVAEQLGLFAGDVSADSYRQDSYQAAWDVWSVPPVSVETAAEGRIESNESTVPTGFGQSAPGMITMFAMFFMLGGASVLIVEREMGTLRRLLVMPVSKASILLGKLVGIFLSGMVQISLLILGGALIFGIDWGQEPFALTLVAASFALAVTGLTIMMAALVRTVSQVNGMGTVMVLSLSALGGAWWPLETIPQWMQTLGRLSPVAWAMDGFHDIITRGLGMEAVLPKVAVLLGFALIFFVIGLSRFRYE